MIYDKFLKYYQKFTLFPRNSHYEAKLNSYTNQILEQNGGDISEINRIITDFKNKITKSKTSIDKLKEIKDSILNGFKLIRTESDNLKSELERIKETKNCSEADKKTIEDLNKQIKDLTEKVTKAEKESETKINSGANIATVTADATKQQKEFNEQLEKIKNSLIELSSFYDQNIGSLDKEIQDIINILDKQLNMSNTINTSPTSSPTSPKAKPTTIAEGKTALRKIGRDLTKG